MPTYVLSLMVASLLVLFFVVGLGGLSMLFGVFSQFMERPKIKFLRPQNSYNLAFYFDWPSTKDHSKIDYIKLSLYNPFGSPTRSELTRSFKPQDRTFVEEIQMGQAMTNFLGASGFSKAEVGVELGSSKEGLSYQFSYSGSKFQELVQKAKSSILEEQKILEKKNAVAEIPYEVPAKSFIADALPQEEGAALVLPSNPAFQKLFAGSGGDAGGSSAAAQNFKVAKVWIEPGCIVCNACEGTYPEVFEVKPDTCVIRPNAPLDDGLKIKEAAEGCPVEVIKYTVS